MERGERCGRVFLQHAMERIRRGVEDAAGRVRGHIFAIRRVTQLSEATEVLTGAEEVEEDILPVNGRARHLDHAGTYDRKPISGIAGELDDVALMVVLLAERLLDLDHLLGSQAREEPGRTQQSSLILDRAM